jgi:hypothetical protein
MLHSVNELQRYEIQAADGTIGTVRGFYFDDNNWEIHYLVVDVGARTVGKKVIVSPAVIGKPDRDNAKLPVDLTMQKIKDSPAIEHDAPLGGDFEDGLNAYYGWRTGQPTVEFVGDEEFEGEEGDLRSTSEIKGFCVETRDGDIGHIDDFIIDDETWTVRFVVVDTRNWLPAKRVLVDVSWIESLSWDDDKAHFTLSKKDIQEAPAFDADKLPKSETGFPFPGKEGFIERRPEM